MDPSEIIWHDEDCFLAAVPPPVKRRDTLILPYQLLVWACIFVAIVACIMFIFIYVSVFGDRAELTHSKAFLYFWAAVFQEPEQKMNYIKSYGLRIYLVTFTSMFFILSQSYSGNLVSYLSIPPKLNLMVTLRDVSESSLIPYSFPSALYSPELERNEHKQKIMSKAKATFELLKYLPETLAGKATLIGSKKNQMYLIKENEERYQK